MEESILISVKKMLGIDSTYDDFDADIKMCINSAIHTLYQVGYKNASDFFVKSTHETWKDLFGCYREGVTSTIQSYIYARVRLLFDPPTSSFVLTSLENQIKEMEWRIYAEMEGGFDDEEDCDCSIGGHYHPESCDDKPSRFDRHRHHHCGGPNPWEGVPGNGPSCDERPEPGYSDTLRRLRNEMGRP